MAIDVAENVDDTSDGEHGCDEGGGGRDSRDRDDSGDDSDGED